MDSTVTLAAKSLVGDVPEVNLEESTKCPEPQNNWCPSIFFEKKGV